MHIRVRTIQHIFWLEAVQPMANVRETDEGIDAPRHDSASERHDTRFRDSQQFIGQLIVLFTRHYGFVGELR